MSPSPQTHNGIIYCSAIVDDEIKMKKALKIKPVIFYEQ